MLIRPGMDMEELRDSTKLRTARGWSWEARTPGTARTIALSAALLTLVAIPAILASPAVLEKLLELAALDLAGETPASVLQKTGTYLP